MKIFFSPSRKILIPGDWLEDGTYAPGACPSDAIEITEKEKEKFWAQPAPAESELGSSKGRPAWVKTKPVELSEDQAKAARLNAYRVESDPIFMEWQFDQSEEKEQQWRASVEAIKARYPLP